ncbi:MAG: hypothetical protein AAF487_06415 [Bacteroidota bacterium]
MDLLISPYNFLKQDAILVFGLYSLLFLFSRIFFKKTWLLDIDKKASQIICVSCIVVFSLLLFDFIHLILTNNPHSLLNGYTKDLFIGKYWFSAWFEPALHLILGVMFSIELFRRNILFRLVFGLFFTIGMERYVIFITSLHEDYMPSNWLFHFDSAACAQAISGLLVFIALSYALFRWKRSSKKA